MDRLFEPMIKIFMNIPILCIFTCTNNTQYYRVGENVAHGQKWTGLRDQKQELVKTNNRYGILEPLRQYIMDCNIATVPKHLFDKPELLIVDNASLMAEWVNDVHEIFPAIVFGTRSINILYHEFHRYRMRVLLKFLKRKCPKLSKNKDLEWSRYEKPKYFVKFSDEIQDKPEV